jgi:hypothetical protein
VDDMIAILEHMLTLGSPPEEVDVTAPATTPAVSPDPNAAGWHNDDVHVGLSAIDNAGAQA